MSPENKEKLKKIRKKLDNLDNSLLLLIKKRTELVKSVLKLKSYKYEIIDKKRIKIILKNIKKKSLKQKETGGAPLTVSADLIVFLGSDESNGITGKLISAMWDNWKEWPKHLDELNKSDVYSLRRITGRDRAMDWGDH